VTIHILKQQLNAIPGSDIDGWVLYYQQKKCIRIDDKSQSIFICAAGIDEWEKHAGIK